MNEQDKAAIRTLPHNLQYRLFITKSKRLEIYRIQQYWLLFFCDYDVWDYEGIYSEKSLESMFKEIERLYKPYT